MHLLRPTRPVASLALGLLLCSASFGDPTRAVARFEIEIIYDPQPAQLPLERVESLIARGAIPGRIDAVAIILPAAGADGNLVAQVNEVARKIEGMLSQEARTRHGQPVPSTVTPVYTDNSAELIRNGYKFRSDDVIPSDDGRTSTRLIIYFREIFPSDAQYGEARGSLMLRIAPRMEPNSRVHLNATTTPLRTQHRNAPANADANVLKVKMAQFQREIDAEVSRLLQDLNGRSLGLSRAEIEAILNGQTEVTKELTFRFFGEQKKLPVVIRARLGKRVIVDSPGTP